MSSLQTPLWQNPLPNAHSREETNSRSSLSPSVPDLSDRIVAIGASTGGVEAIQSILHGLNGTPLSFVVTQHMPAAYIKGFAERLSRATSYEVKEAEAGDRVRPGLVLLAPGGRHLTLAGSRSILTCRLDDGPPVCGFKPSIDVMFSSVAQAVGAKAIGILLTGMGRDGAEGLLMMRNFRALTLCESEKSAIVFGMPKAGLAIGAASDSVPLDDIPGWILDAAAERPMPPPQVDSDSGPLSDLEAEFDPDTVFYVP
jgi:two-component system, chemotaxis family, protein-glutamate methylesterase/glutaminase